MKSSPSSFAYIDPESQRTGSMSMESDVYALGVFLLQLITAAPPMGLVQKVRRAVDVCKIRAVADANLSAGPVEGLTELANLALSCTEIVAKDRTDLVSIVIPALKWSTDLNQ
ncbi:hypothetical protein HPP92_012618 [Vanilla planifolia]|uniref:RING-type E3 ubiquitin transferase n=1 Tax=Vanilla planifolia TaxID=51239 RepID=A0A835QYL9_VANPL|nr:hypothetical protein HPP92_013028 [Vanilla planifolia]KAG0477899.1 hypothetical protein HPP92_012618 [Vanilla planifolia]